MSADHPIPQSWTFETIWACEAKIDWNSIIEIKSEGQPLSRKNAGIITRIGIEPTNRG